MFNPRISGIFAALGFVLSFLVGLVSGAHLPLLLIRAFIFAAVFFALASAGYGAIQMYLPELVAGESGGAPALGGQVDISIGDDDEGAGDISLESGSLGDELNEFLENPGNSGRDTLDQTAEAVYTGEGETEGIQEPQRPALPDDSGFSPGDAESVDMLPDLDAMSGVLNSGSIPAAGNAEPAGTGFPASSFDGPGGMDLPGGQSGKKGLDENFNVKEMASAVQTILKRENKG
jgi:hypothetical protein